MKFHRNTYMEINLNHVLHNVQSLKTMYFPNLDIMAVIKADSYGHGAVMVARALETLKVAYFAVATLDEAIELRRAHITTPIFILGGVRIEDLPLIVKYQLTISVHSLYWLERASMIPHLKPIKIHLKLDTGMHRLGMTPEEFRMAYELVRTSKTWKLEGIFSHLATSEEDDQSYYQQQMTLFQSCLDKIDTNGLIIHIDNSAGAIKPHPPFVTMVRIGLMINGQKPRPDLKLSFDLKPSLSLYSSLVQVKLVPKNQKLSYNGLYKTKDDEWIGTIPIGYADGLDRRYFDGYVYVDGHRCLIVGRICMDYTLIRLPKYYPEGTQIEIFGEHISIDEYAEKIKTNTYQATCLLSDRLPRLYRFNDKIVSVVNRRLLGKIGGHL